MIRIDFTDFVTPRINLIKDWDILYFADNSKPSGKDTHYHIIIPAKQDKLLIICMITSQIENCRLFWEASGEDKNFVDVNPKNLSCLDKDSIVLCPETELVTKKCLIERISSLNAKKTDGCIIAECLKKEILTCIQRSNVVEEIIKESLPVL
jgi:hypothetical protein